MSSRKSKIMLLKQKICMMQNQLIMMTQDNSKFPQSRSHSKNKSINSNRGNSRNRQFQSPSFRISQIGDKEKQSSKTKQMKASYDRQKSREKIQSRLSPKLKNIINTVKTKYYVNNSSIDLLPPQINATQSVKNFKSPQKISIYNSVVVQDENKKQKIKTYDFNKTVPIINPERNKQMVVKNIQNKQKSPNRISTENTKQNPLLLCYIEKVVFLQKKQRVDEQDKSLLSFTSVKNVVSRQNGSPKPRKSQKKHFARYFEQNLFSQMY